MKTRNEEQVLRQFPRDIEHHVMNEETYVPGSSFRSIYFGKPGTGQYHFRLVTWPGCLTIEGDMGCFTFTRLPDMFEFFRMTNPKYGIDHRYWAEKVIGSPKEFNGDGVTEYSAEMARKHVLDAINERFADKPPKGGKGSGRQHWEDWALDLGQGVAAEAMLSGGIHEFTRKDLIELAETKEGGIRATFQVELLDYVDEPSYFYEKLYAYNDQHGVYLGADDFPRFDDYTYRFYWACEAIQWGIAQWDQQQVQIALEEKALADTSDGTSLTRDSQEGDQK